MEEVKNFLLQNWQFVITVALLIAAFIVSLFRGLKKGLSISDILLGYLLDQVPMWINAAEDTHMTGQEKRVQVLNNALTYAGKQLGRNLNEQESALIVAHVSQKIEEILSTPQKKESQQPNKSKYR